LIGSPRGFSGRETGDSITILATNHASETACSRSRQRRPPPPHLVIFISLRGQSHKNRHLVIEAAGFGRQVSIPPIPHIDIEHIASYTRPHPQTRRPSSPLLASPTSNHDINCRVATRPNAESSSTSAIVLVNLPFHFSLRQCARQRTKNVYLFLNRFSTLSARCASFCKSFATEGRCRCRELYI